MINIANSKSIGAAIASAISVIVLSGCTTDSATSGLRPTAAIGNQTQQQQQAAQQNTQQGTQPTAQTALLPDNQPVQNASLQPTQPIGFLPVVGPPQFAVSKLSSSIRSSAKANNVTIAQAGQRAPAYQVKGYFSALDDGTGTRFVYIWDVLDAAGRNVHRISGEERSGGRSADPWQSVDANMISAVVDRTMQNLRGWIATKG